MMIQMPRFRLQGVQRQAKAVYGFALARLTKEWLCRSLRFKATQKCLSLWLSCLQGLLHAKNPTRRTQT